MDLFSTPQQPPSYGSWGQLTKEQRREKNLNHYRGFTKAQLTTLHKYIISEVAFQKGDEPRFTKSGLMIPPNALWMVPVWEMALELISEVLKEKEKTD